MRTLKALLACCVVGLMVATLAGPVLAKDLADDEYAAILTSLADRLTAAQAEVQAELEAIERCIEDLECMVILHAGSAALVTSGQIELFFRLVGAPQAIAARGGPTGEAWTKAIRQQLSRSPADEREATLGLRLSLASEWASLDEMRQEVAAELEALTGQQPADASVAESETEGNGPASQMAGTDTAGIAEGPSLQDFGIDPDAIPGGDGFGYAVVCRFISTENGLEIARSKLRSPSRAEIGQTIALVPNGCRPTATRSTQLEIEVTRIGDPASTVTVAGSVLTGE